MATSTDFDTGPLRAWQSRKPCSRDNAPEVYEARQALKRTFGEARKHALTRYRKAREDVLKSHHKSRLLSIRPELARPPPPTRMLVEGEWTADRETWRTGATKVIHDRFRDPLNTFTQQEHRLEAYAGIVAEHQAEPGCGAPDPSLFYILEATARMNEGKGVGPDGIPAEVWNALP